MRKMFLNFLFSKFNMNLFQITFKTNFYEIKFIFFDIKTAIKHALDENNFDEVKKILGQFKSKSIKKYGKPKTMNIDSDENEKDQNLKPKRKRGRPPKPKNEIQNACKELHMKEITNETRMEQLENPKLISIKNQHKYVIEISSDEQNNNKDIMQFYENSIKGDVDWKSIDPEQIFPFNLNDQKLRKQNGEVKDDEMNNDEMNNDEMNNDEMYNNEMQDEEYSSNEYSTDEYSEEEDDLNDELERDNLKSFSPFKDPSDAYTQISKVNKKYRIKQIQSNDPKSLLFKCSNKGCFYQVICIYKDDGYYVEHQSVHTCTSTDEKEKKRKVERKVLYDAVMKFEEQEHISISYKNQICDYLDVPRGSIPHQRIERAHDKVFNKNKPQRLKTWGKLESFLEIIKARGGYGLIHKNDEGKIDFVGFAPDYSIRFIHSSLFFGVTQMDTRFQTGISRGNLYLMITLTGDRTVLPIGAAWAPSEACIFTDMFLGMFKDDIKLIKSCLTDEAFALITSIEKVKIKNFLCTWHMELHCNNKYMFKSLVSCSNSHDYSIIKHKINTECEDLKDYLDKNNHWEKVTRFESEFPRDHNLATAGVESLNSIIARYHFKKKEPLDVFLFIYEFGFLTLQKICSQTLFFTDAVSDWLSYALHVAHNLDVSKSILDWGLYEVTKGKNQETACSVMIIPGQKPSCSCKFFEDCGMPCVHLIAVAVKYNLDWCAWVHPRYFTSEYKSLFQNNLNYPDFKQVVQTNKDKPVNIGSLKQKTKRIRNPGEVKKSKKSKK